MHDLFMYDLNDLLIPALGVSGLSLFLSESFLLEGVRRRITEYMIENIRESITRDIMVVGVSCAECIAATLSIIVSYNVWRTHFYFLAIVVWFISLILIRFVKVLEHASTNRS